MSALTTRQLTRRQHAYQYQQGFSLVELMTVIAVMGVIVAMASPSITSALERQRNKETTQTLVQALKEARVESLFRRQDITVSVVPAANTVSVTASGGKEVIRSYATPTAIPMVAANSSIVFKSNKTVSVNNFKVDTFCDKNKTRKGRAVTVDANGNISVDNGGSQC